MALDQVPSDIVTIFQRGRDRLYADDKRVMVYTRGSGTHRLKWARVTGFADGGVWKHGEYVWQLDIVTRTGWKKAVPCTAGAFTPELLAGLREVAARHGVPVDVEGVAPPAGPPETQGFYEDPGGADGMRYWDGRLWSPLLPADIRRPWPPMKIRKSVPSWASLPVDDEPWKHASRQAQGTTASAVLAGALSVGLLGWTLLTVAGVIPPPDQQTGPAEWLLTDAFALGYLFWARWLWRAGRFYRALDKAVRDRPAAPGGS
jgi:hypothetical protein